MNKSPKHPRVLVDGLEYVPWNTDTICRTCKYWDNEVPTAEGEANPALRFAKDWGMCLSPDVIKLVASPDFHEDFGCIYWRRQP